MRSAVGSPDTLAATEYSQQSRSRWQTLGVATTTEHSELTATASRDTAFAPRVVSIGSVKIFREARHDSATLTKELVRRGIQERLHVAISCHDISNQSNRAATKHTNTRPYPYMYTSWSAIIERISESVAAYQRTPYATEPSGCANILYVLKTHVQTLLHKCIPGAYVRDCAMNVITEYIWNRTCNEAFLMLLDDIITEQWPREKLSQSEIYDAIELIETCLRCLTTDHDDILIELKHYCSSATEPPKISLAAACHVLLLKRSQIL